MTKPRPAWVDRAISQQILTMPPYVPGKPIEEVERELGISNAVKMASNENPLGPSPLAMQAIRERLERVHIYPESSAPRLREAIAARFGLSSGAAILGNGSDELMEIAAHVFLQPGDEAVASANSFSMYRISVEAFGGKLRCAALKGYSCDLSAMSAAVNDRTRLVFLAVPNSPTGSIVTRRDFEAFMRDLPSEGLVLVIDEAYREFVQADDCPNGIDYVGKGLPVLVLRTFSKIYGLAGLRVGYGFSDEWVIELMNRVRPPFNVNSLAQAAALAALDDHDHVERSRRNTIEGMQLISTELKAMGIEVIPSEANFLTFRLEPDARGVYDALLRQGLIVRHLASFGLDDCIRVTIGTPEQNRRFLDGLKRALAGYSVSSDAAKWT